jgi:transposase-like protein
MVTRTERRAGYALSYRNVVELLAERGLTVDQVTAFRAAQRFTPLWIDVARPGRHVPGTLLPLRRHPRAHA